MTGKVVSLNQGYPERRPDQVTTFDHLSTSQIGYRSNPDTLVGRHGLAIYSRMANDEQVKAVLNFKRDAITARGWQFKFREGTSLSASEQALRIRIFTEMLARMRGSFADAMNSIMTGRAYGFSITEKVYGEIEVDGKVWPGINKLLGRDPMSFRFYTDDYGSLDKIEQQTNRAGLIEVDRNRIIHYVHAPEWDHVWGRSDLREAYRSWYIKDQISGLWAMYLERMAGGFLHASQADGVELTTAETEALDEALKKSKSLGAIRTPPGITLNVIHPPATDGYKVAIEFHDLAIAKALLVPNLLGISSTGGTGSYSQSQTQLDAFFWTLNADSTRLEECLNEQLFRDLGDQAWGDKEYPEFKFKPASLEHVKWTITTWQALVGAKVVIPTEEDEAFLRKLMEMPERDEKSTVLEDPVAKAAAESAERIAASNAEAAAAQGADDGAALPGEAGADPEADDAGDPKKRTPIGKGKEQMRRRLMLDFVRELFGFNPDQPRDADGKFAPSGGGGDSSGGGLNESEKRWGEGRDRPEPGTDIRVRDGMQGGGMRGIVREGDISSAAYVTVALQDGTSRTYHESDLLPVSDDELEREQEDRDEEDLDSRWKTGTGRYIRERQSEQPPSRVTLRTHDSFYVTFDSQTSRDGWLHSLKPGYTLVLDEAVDIADATPPLGDVFSTVRVVDAPQSLPAGARLKLIRVADGLVEAKLVNA